MTVRYALDRGISVVVEGIFEPSRYGDMLTAVATDHLGVTRAYFWNIDFAETVRRYGTKTKAADFGEAEMATWWYGLSLVRA